MWPKALAQLIELAPHITRLVPMADRFFNAKSADAEASRNAMQQMAEGLRGDLGQVTASHAGLYRQLNDQSEKLSVLSAELRSNKLSLDALDERLLLLERQNKTLITLAVVVLIGVIGVIVLLAIPYFHHH
jgi:phage-related tail protein